MLERKNIDEKINFSNIFNLKNYFFEYTGLKNWTKKAIIILSIINIYRIIYIIYLNFLPWKGKI